MTPAKTIKWHKLADTLNDIQWQQNNMAIVQLAGKKLTLILYKDELHACAAACPHASGVLANGYLDAAGNVVCPLHKYKFNPVNGHNVSGEGYRLKVYAVEKRAAGIFIGFEEDVFTTPGSML